MHTTLSVYDDYLLGDHTAEIIADGESGKLVTFESSLTNVGTGVIVLSDCHLIFYIDATRFSFYFSQDSELLFDAGLSPYATHDIAFATAYTGARVLGPVDIAAPTITVMGYLSSDFVEGVTITDPTLAFTTYDAGSDTSQGMISFAWENAGDKTVHEFYVAYELDGVKTTSYKQAHLDYGESGAYSQMITIDGDATSKVATNMTFYFLSIIEYQSGNIALMALLVILSIFGLVIVAPALAIVIFLIIRALIRRRKAKVL